MHKKKLFIITTIPVSLIFFKGQLSLLKNEFDVTLISSPEEGLFKTANDYHVKCHGIKMKREISFINDEYDGPTLTSYQSEISVPTHASETYVSTSKCRHSSN